MTTIDNPEYEYEEVQDPQGNQEDPIPQESSGISSLRKAHDETSKELREVRRQLALTEAGIPKDHPALPLFREAKDIEWGDPVKVKEAAEKYGLLTPQPEETPIPNEEVQAHERMSEAVTSGESVDPNADKPWTKPNLTLEEATQLYETHHPRGFANLS